MELYRHQQESFKFFKERQLCADLSDPGTGKTLVQIKLLLERESKLNLIIAPSSTLVKVWKMQMDEHFPERSQVVLNKGSKAALKYLQQLKEARDGRDGGYYNIIISYDTAKMILPKKQNVVFGLNQFYWDTIILDESTKIKNPKSLRTKRILKLRSKYKSIMTGTVAPNSLMDVFPQYAFLSEQIFGPSWFYFREKYFKKSSWNEYDWTLRKGAADQIRAKMEPYSIQNKKKDCLDLPPLTQEFREVEMTAEQKSAYKQMKEEMIVWLSENDNIRAPFVITKLMKLRQISAGFIMDSETREVYNLKENRTKELVEIIEQIPGKVIVFAHFKESIRKICEALSKKKISHIQFTGNADEISEFENRAKVFVANPMSAGHGLNLQFASDIIYYEKDFNLEVFLQSIDRINRIGQQNRMTVYHIESSPIDKHVTKRLNTKEDILKTLDINKLKEML